MYMTYVHTLSMSHVHVQVPIHGLHICTCTSTYPRLTYMYMTYVHTLSMSHVHVQVPYSYSCLATT